MRVYLHESAIDNCKCKVANENKVGHATCHFNKKLKNLYAGMTIKNHKQLKQLTFVQYFLGSMLCTLCCCKSAEDTYTS